MREWVPVVVQGRAASGPVVLARTLWVSAEIAVTVGLVVLLFVVHQLWWTNRQARDGAERTVRVLERQWGSGPRARPGAQPDGEGKEKASAPSAGREPHAAKPTAPRWDQAYAIVRIPRIGLTAPVAQGVGKAAVLNHGYVGHYPHTTQPGQPGNFALAGHRNTHGEPFRYLDRLRAGDTITVETAEGRYVYAVEKTIPQTSPTDGTVIQKVPYSSVRTEYRYDEPGYYITLTTCTPEYTSRYRLVVWGRLRSMEPRG